MATSTFASTRAGAIWSDYVAPLYSWIKELTKGEKLLLIAVLCFGAVGSYNTHEFYAPSRGPFVGWMAAIGNRDYHDLLIGRPRM